MNENPLTIFQVGRLRPELLEPLLSGDGIAVSYPDGELRWDRAASAFSQRDMLRSLVNVSAPGVTA